MTQSSAAQFFNSSQTAISDWENLLRCPAIEDIPRLSEFLEIPETNVYLEIKATFFPDNTRIMGIITQKRV